MSAFFVTAVPLPFPGAGAGRTQAKLGLGVLAVHAGFLWSVWSGPSVVPLRPPVVVQVWAMNEAPAVSQQAASVAPSPPVPSVPQRSASGATSVHRAAVATPATETVPPVLPQAPSAAPLTAASAPAVSSTAPGTGALPAPASVAPAPAPAPVLMELPTTLADYLQNPKPVYPPLSKRLGEQGKVVLRVWIDADGRAAQAEIKVSSGYERLDQAALKTVLSWRYVPGKRNGVPEGMWFNVPINFVLE